MQTAIPAAIAIARVFLDVLSAARIFVNIWGAGVFTAAASGGSVAAGIGSVSAAGSAIAGSVAAGVGSVSAAGSVVSVTAGVGSVAATGSAGETALPQFPQKFTPSFSFAPQLVQNAIFFSLCIRTANGYGNFPAAGRGYDWRTRIPSA
jgi:hypothetical protein